MFILNPMEFLCAENDRVPDVGPLTNGQHARVESL